MEYLIAGLLVALIVAAGVAVVARRATRHEGGRAASDAEYGDGTAILAPDRDSPLGDTSEHADSEEPGRELEGDPHVARPVDGGEGEGTRRI